MTKTIALINVASQNFQALYDKVNELANLVAQEIVTANTQANGATTAGNAYFTGIFSANVFGVYGGLRGGNVQSTATLPITSNVHVQGDKLYFGNSTVNSHANSSGFTVSNSTVNYTYVLPTAAQKAATTSYLNGNGSWVTTNMYIDGGNTGFGATPVQHFDVIRTLNSGTVVARFRNSSTTSSLAAIRIDAGGRYVTQQVNYASQFFQENGSNINTKYVDFNTQIFRNNGGGTTNFQVVNNGVIVAAGNTGNRPSATSGTIRYNTEENQFEGVVSGAYDKLISRSDLLKVYDESNTQIYP